VTKKSTLFFFPHLLGETKQTNKSKRQTTRKIEGEELRGRLEEGLETMIDGVDMIKLHYVHVQKCHDETH
jgi:hypothetical protein